MRLRPSARLIVLDASCRVLLFHFRHASTGQRFWATPGGGLEAGESYEAAARRELAEETGLRDAEIGTEVHRREFELTMCDGEVVWAEERFFLVRTAASDIDTAGWTEEERDVILEHGWWTLEALRATAETVFPEDLADVLAGLTTR